MLPHRGRFNLPLYLDNDQLTYCLIDIKKLLKLHSCWIDEWLSNKETISFDDVTYIYQRDFDDFLESNPSIVGEIDHDRRVQDNRKSDRVLRFPRATSSSGFRAV